MTFKLPSFTRIPIYTRIKYPPSHDLRGNLSKRAFTQHLTPLIFLRNPSYAITLILIMSFFSMHLPSPSYTSTPPLIYFLYLLTSHSPAHAMQFFAHVTFLLLTFILPSYLHFGLISHYYFSNTSKIHPTHFKTSSCSHHLSSNFMLILLHIYSTTLPSFSSLLSRHSFNNYLFLSHSYDFQNSPSINF